MEDVLGEGGYGIEFPTMTGRPLGVNEYASGEPEIARLSLKRGK